MTEIRTNFKNTMEEIVALRARIVAEAHELSHGDILCFTEECYHECCESSIYHILCWFDGDIELKFNRERWGDNWKTKFFYNMFDDPEVEAQAIEEEWYGYGGQGRKY